MNFYSFWGEQPEQLDYLSDVPAGQKMRQYKLGTIAHEITHHIYHYLMDADKRARWQNLINRTQAITAYAKFYAGCESEYDESFSEAVRLKTTTPDYLKTNFPEIDQFLTDNFPNVRRADLS